MNSPVGEAQQAGATIVWPRTGPAAASSPSDATSEGSKGSKLPETPAEQIERILREYASECYAVGRGESMYYLVEDLPRIAHAATQEIMAVRPLGVADRWRMGFGLPKVRPPLPRVGSQPSVLAVGGAKAYENQQTQPVHKEEGPLLMGQMSPAGAERGARSVVEVLPVLTVIAALGLTVLLAVAAL
ncbi:MAG: hypothetical protein ACR2QM_19830 [Longimicrobiales bacterium]